ncbi:hypothetical protein CH63R_03643 [Colletotrichum higginsianum IMI 349063]|uniref:Uncharacterized protein n=1 Tax=Colletotrichum higginsianum (strain IMI 349063) TaxID=759273 RepID=A0A1B7YGZ9_COLHI|nr:hypothetical protein CH63R_03643 [Colletotrichum higginsianum IMI 349063]OBR11347.1 hypothetical protein CH63R_03643 [Colletotrichum higginsianum IMI 349063]
MWPLWSSFKRLLARDYCEEVDGKAFWPGTGDNYYLGSPFLVSWFAGKASGYTNTTTALWNVWVQDVKYEEKTKDGGSAFRLNIYSRNITYNTEGDNWMWVPTDVCNQTVVSFNYEIPKDFEATGTYMVAAVREGAVTTSAATATSGPFTIIASSDPKASATEATNSQTTGTQSSPTGVLSVGTAVASSPANNDDRITPGAAAGIATGAVVIFLGLAGLLWFFWRRRRNNKRLAAAVMAREADGNSGYAKPELDGQAVVTEGRGTDDTGESKPAHLAELDSQQPWRFQSVAAEEKGNALVEETPMAELGAGSPLEGYGNAKAHSGVELE